MAHQLTKVTRPVSSVLPGKGGLMTRDMEGTDRPDKAVETIFLSRFKLI
ncbi:MAG: hypothetical protein KKC99_04065 [Proteobacteria bacterium]|nr:hypothetical protein [Pseudomonadota bacterium]